LTRFLTKTTGVLLLLAVLCAVAGCSPKDNLGGLNPTCIYFNAGTPAAVEVVAVVSDLSDCNTAVIELVVTGVDNLWGVSFELDYPSGISQVFPIDVTTSVLGAEPELIYNLEEDPLGHIEVGVSRSNVFFDRGVPMADLDANPVLLRLGFRQLTTGGSGNVTFTMGTTSLSFREPPDPDPQEVTFDDTIPFTGGSLFIQ